MSEVSTTLHDGTESLTIKESLCYDYRGRLLEKYHQVDEHPEVQTAAYEYNSLGQLIDKKLHVQGEDHLQSIDYRYSIQGWLTSINNSQLTKDGISNDDENDLFGMQLYYANEDAALGNTARYNGQISAVTWQTHNPSSTSIGNAERERSYTYHYNKGNRLIAAHYKAKDKGTTQWNQELKGYNTSYSYDLNGNLQSLQRNAMDINGTIVQMDDLLYTYTGNRVRQVTDRGDKTLGFEEIAGITAPYDYDANGNITTQANRGINTVEYNYLDKVTKVEKVKNGQTITIEYVYTAEGNKIQKLETIAGKTTQTDYVANQVFKDHMLEYIQFDEGRIRTTSSYTTFLLADEIQYEYYLKDHLGNVRMVVEKDEATGELIVSQENHYSPYGLKLEGYINNTSIASNPNPYGFGGSEIESALNTWHLHYRMYDPAIGMFWQVDPAKHMLNMTSPYMYVHGDPANFTDPLGACEIPLRCDDNVGPTLENPNFFSLDQYTGHDVEESKTRVIEGTMSLEIKVHYEMSQEKEIVEEPRQLTKEEKQEIVDDWKSQSQNLSWMDYPVGEPEDLSIDEGFNPAVALMSMATSFRNILNKAEATHRGDDTYTVLEIKKRRLFSGAYEAIVVPKEMTFGTTESLIQGVADGVGVIPSSSGAGAYAKTGASKTLAKKAVQEVAKEGRNLWKLTDEGASVIKRHSQFGKIFKSKTDGLWWAVDNAGHGGSKFKVFKEGKKGLEWFRDADEFGDFIINKHKGSTGKFIPWGQLKTIK